MASGFQDWSPDQLRIAVARSPFLLVPAGPHFLRVRQGLATAPPKVHGAWRSTQGASHGSDMCRRR